MQIKIKVLSLISAVLIIAVGYVAFFSSINFADAMCCNPCMVCTTPFCPPPCVPSPTPVPGTFSSIGFSPNIPDTSTNVTGVATGSYDLLTSQETPFTVTAANYSVDSGSSNAISLTQTQAGVSGTIGINAKQYTYSFSFSLTTSGLSNGSHSITFSGTSAAGMTSYTTNFTVAHIPPAVGTINVTADRIPSTNPGWYISGPSNYSDNGVSSATHSSTPDGSYVLKASSGSSSIPYAFSLSNSGAVCSNSQTCTLTTGGTINYTLTSTYCTIVVNTYLNGTLTPGSGINYNLTGPYNTYSAQTSGKTFSPGTLDSNNLTGPLADSSGSTFTLTYNSPVNFTYNGYLDDFVNVTPAVSQSCNAGGNLTFNINFKSRPVLNVQ